MPKKYSGFAPVVVVVIVAILAAAAGGFYFLSKKGSSPISLPGQISKNLEIIPRVTEKDFEFIEDSNLRKHFVAQANQLTYRTKSLSSGAGLVFTNEIQIKGDDFNHREIQSEPNNNELKHMITLGDTIYVKDYSDSKWWKQTIKPEEVKKEEENKPEEPEDFKDFYSQKDTTYKFLGMEACGDLNCFKYESTIANEGLPVTRTFWFDDKKYLLRKEKSQAGEFSTETEYSYDNINIKEPSPTKDVPEGKSVYDYYFQSGSAAPAAPAGQPQQQMQPNPDDFKPEDYPTYSEPEGDQ